MKLLHSDRGYGWHISISQWKSFWSFSIMLNGHYFSIHRRLDNKQWQVSHWENSFRKDKQPIRRFWQVV